ncbi:MAG: hypothetical protein M1830_000104 [Pleopsidium flavum]|nr:MAG: hypothetical protein M1830_000104 [Pleopsidium flavum]
MEETSQPSSTDSEFQIFSSTRYDLNLENCEANNPFNHPQGSSSPFYMLRYHRDRMLNAAQHFGLERACARLGNDMGFKSFTQLLQQRLSELNGPDHCLDPLKVGRPEFDMFSLKSVTQLRILISRSGKIIIEPSPTPPVPLSSLFPTSLDPPATGSVQPWRILIDDEPTPSTPYTRHKTVLRDPYTDARSRSGISSFAHPVEVILFNSSGEITEGSLTSVYFLRGRRWVTPPVDSGGNQGTTRRWALEKGLCEERVVRVEEVSDGEGVWVSNGVRGFTWGIVSLNATR